MSTKREIFEKVLTKEFSKDNFVQFSKEFFNDLKDAGQYTDNSVYNSFNNYIESYTNIGNFMSEENKKISIFAIRIKTGKSVDGARSIQRNFVKDLLETGNSAAGLAAFYTADDKKWKLSLITLEYEFAKGKIIEKLTPAKRSSYLVGEGEPCHTALERLFPIFQDDNKNPTIDAMKEAFSVEKVTSEFFEKYSDKFYQVREYLEANKDFKQEAERHGFTSEQFTKKLMGQIAFLYFVQKKGWLGVNAFPRELTEKEYKNYFYYSKKTKEIMEKIYIKSGDVFKRNTKEIANLSADENDVISRVIKGDSWGNGPKDFMRKLFDDCINKGKNYFDDYLEPLFYDALNKNRGSNAYFSTLHCRIPFLNGGLFEQLDNYDWKSNDFNIPNEMFSNRNEKGEYDADGILDVFDRYNFTISEDEPMEREVAVDPEMLGKIFENLLEIRERKDKGAFYTPREIVHYMCQESLIQYLTEQTKISHEAISNFILYGEFLRDHDINKQSTSKDGMLISKEIYDPNKNINKFDEIDKALKAVRVADPAVGSGAFPLGMLNEIVKAREVITGYLALERNGFEKKSMYAMDRNPYTLKSETIRDSIFAVDIEPSAVDIAKLRLWLSLIIDDQINPEADENNPLTGHKNPNPLPNLECNIICGDSLIDEIDGIKLITPSELFGSTNHQKQLSNNKYEGLLNQLFDLQYKLYHEDNHEGKESTKKKIRSLIDTIVMFNLQTVSEDIKEKYRKYSKEHSLPFTLWQLEFGRVFKEKGGFDIIIGNPPYVQLQKMKDETDKIEHMNYKAYARTGDLYCIFYEQGYNLLCPNGTLAFITSNKWMRAGYGEKLRDFFAKYTNPVYLIDFGGQKVFESATVDVNILIFSKNANKNKTLACTIKEKCSDNLSNYVQQNVSTCKFSSSESWVVLSPIEQSIKQKIETVGTPLKDWDINIYRGVLTGCNEAFIISKEKKEEILSNCSSKEERMKTDEIIRPILRGRDIKRYGYEFANLWLIWVPWHFPLHLDNSIQGASEKAEKAFMEKYPAIYSHLLAYKAQLSARNKAETGIRYEWYALQRWGANYWEDFYKQKIMYSEIVKLPQFYLDNKGEYFPEATTFIMTGKNLEYLYNLFHSKTITYFFKTFYAGGGLGESGYRYKKAFFEKLPIPLWQDTEYQKQIKSAMPTETIDNLVCNLYGLNKDETEYIQNI